MPIAYGAYRIASPRVTGYGWYARPSLLLGTTGVWDLRRIFWGILMSNSLTDLFASRFIARRDVKAVQLSSGGYNPIRERWQRADLEAHLAKTITFGHYLLDTDDTTKLFCFDIDLKKQGYLPVNIWDPTSDYLGTFQPADVRAAWADHQNPHRPYLKYCMRLIAHLFAERITSYLEIPVAVAYSGSKGIHVYGFTGRVPANDARDGAQIVIDSIGRFELERGESLYTLKPYPDGTLLAEDPFINFSVEIYPKQTTLADKDLGNLLRLPLGRNTKSEDPTFFMDMTAPLVLMKPVDPEWALTTSNPWKRPDE